MNRLPREKRAKIIGMMCEGVSLRSITRLTGVSRTTLHKLLEDAGRAFSEYQDKNLRNLSCKRLQLDEIWSFVYAKEKNVPKHMRNTGEAGDLWTWTAIDADTKLIPSWYVGERDADAAERFVRDLASRLANRVQITSDGHKPYVTAINAAFGDDVDYAMLVKIYGNAYGDTGPKKYSPAECIGAKKQRITGKPDKKHVSTSFAERANLSIRMGLRRFTRLTNAFSKKVENHVHALSIYFMHYNFVRIHQTLKATPAMAARVTDKPWTLENLVRVVDEWELQQQQQQIAA